MDGTPLVVIHYCTRLRPTGLLGGVGRVVGRLPYIDVVTSMRTQENDEKAQEDVAYRSFDVEDLSEGVELGLSGLGPPGADCGREPI